MSLKPCFRCSVTNLLRCSIVLILLALAFQLRNRTVVVRKRNPDSVAAERDAANATAMDWDELTSAVQRRISAALSAPGGERQLVCEFGRHECGFGCLLHAVAICAYIALGTGRQLTARSLTGDDDAALLAHLPRLNGGERRPAVPWNGYGTEEFTADSVASVRTLRATNTYNWTLFVPGTVPDALVAALPNVSSAWWAGQVLRYLLRPSAALAAEVRRVRRQLNYTRPIVGVHVRRGDKFREQHPVALAAYMARVAAWYDARENGTTPSGGRRKVFLAADERAVVDELRATYPRYEFVHQPWESGERREWRTGTSERAHLAKVLTDVYLLQEADHFVCTFSSNVGRLVFELRETDGRRRHATESLDLDWHYHGGYQVAMHGVRVPVRYAAFDRTWRGDGDSNVANTTDY